MAATTCPPERNVLSESTQFMSAQLSKRYPYQSSMFYTLGRYGAYFRETFIGAWVYACMIARAQGSQPEIGAFVC